MKKDYILETGGQIWREDNQPSDEAAVMAALKANRFSVIGVLISAIPVGSEDEATDTRYFDAIHYMKLAGHEIKGI